MIPTLPITISDLSPYPQQTSRNNNKNKKKSLVFLFVLFLLCLFTAFYLIRYMILSSPPSSLSYNHAQKLSDNNIKQEAGEGETSCSLKTSSSANAINKASLLSREDVGRATWKFLHILAQHANNIDNKMDNNNNNNNNILGDTDKEKKMNELLHLVSQLFPCPTCAADFQLILNQHPFSLMKTQFINNNNNINKNNNSHNNNNSKMNNNRNNNKYTMKHYVCDLHNIVNQKLNKPLYDCNNEQQLTQQYAMSECF